MPTAVDHLVLAVSELDPAADELGRLLGLVPSWRGRHPDHGTRNVLFRLENTYVELLAAESDGPLASLLREFLAARGPGLFAVALRAAELDREVVELRRRGVAAGDPTEGSGASEDGSARRRWKTSFLPPARGVRVFFIEHLSGTLPEAVSTGARENAVTACDHVVVETDDPEAAIRFWGEQLGIRLALDRTFPQWGSRLLFFRLGGLTLEFAARLERTAPAGGDRLWGISYRVPDVDAARARIDAAGFDVSEARPGRRPGTRVATVRGEPLGVATLILGPS